MSHSSPLILTSNGKNEMIETYFILTSTFHFRGNELVRRRMKEKKKVSPHRASETAEEVEAWGRTWINEEKETSPLGRTSVESVWVYVCMLGWMSSTKHTSAHLHPKWLPILLLLYEQLQESFFFVFSFFSFFVFFLFLL